MKMRTSMLWIFLVMAALGCMAQNTYPWQSSGNVGIGTTNPLSRLQVDVGSGNTSLVAGLVYGSTQAGQFTGPAGNTVNAATLVVGSNWNNSNSSGAGLLNVYNASGSMLWVGNSGSVGIGTTTPAAKLDVSDQVQIHSGIVKASAYTIGNAASPLFEAFGVQPVPQAGASPAIAGSGFGFVSGSNQASPVIWVYSYGGQNAFRVVSKGWATNITTDPVLFDVDTGGNVGIGTTTPGEKLEVTGNLKLSNGGSIKFTDGSIQQTAWTGTLCGGDYAESVDVSGDRHQYGPGDVLQIDDNDPSKFVRVAEPYSPAVAGVYSTRPGALGRRQTTPKSPDELPLAIIGIVPVKVTAENGAIHPHDLLVSSTKPGYAMKGTDRSKMLGAVIGKAMGSLDKGNGVIEVLVTLQ